MALLLDFALLDIIVPSELQDDDKALFEDEDLPLSLEDLLRELEELAAISLPELLETFFLLNEESLSMLALDEDSSTAGAEVLLSSLHPVNIAAPHKAATAIKVPYKIFVLHIRL